MRIKQTIHNNNRKIKILWMKISNNNNKNLNLQVKKFRNNLRIFLQRQMWKIVIKNKT